MLIFWKERLVFLATTKTGSTSIESALEPLAHVAIKRPPPLKHMRAAAFNRHYRPFLEQTAGGPFTTVALIREPTDWLGSWFRYRQRAELEDNRNSTAELDFEGFVAAYLSDDPPAFAAVGSQARFLGGADRQPLVDRLFRYEALGDFVHFLEEHLGCEITLPRMNVSPKAPMDLAPATRARLRERFAPDYAIWDALG